MGGGLWKRTRKRFKKPVSPSERDIESTTDTILVESYLRH